MTPRQVESRQVESGQTQRGIRDLLRGHRAWVALLVVAQCLIGSRASGQTGPVYGTIRDSAGMAVGGANVRVVGSVAQAVSNGNGAYRLEGIPVGPTQVVVRRLGFKPATLSVTTTPAGTLVDVLLVPIPQTMTPIVVNERREPFDSRLAGFRERAAKRVGHFITRDRIERQGSTFLTEYLRQVPGLKIRTIGGVTNAVRLRGASCPPLVFIDGFPASAGEFDLDIVDPVSVEGIEVYSGSATIPAEFVGPRNLDRCGVIAIWSRPMRPYRRSAGRPVSEASRGAGSSTTEPVLAADQVDQPATLEGDLGVVYPDSLWTARAAGTVVVEFIVDARGDVEPGTVGIISATHPLFAEAVRAALPQAHFAPARLAGRVVRQVVQLPVNFTPVPEATKPPRPPRVSSARGGLRPGP